MNGRRSTNAKPLHHRRIPGTAATLLQLYNASILGTFWPFFTGIVVQLVAAMFQFARIILVPPK
jgi:hypothetical protein